MNVQCHLIYEMDCAAARNACWFTMATLSDGIDSQIILRMIHQFKNDVDLVDSDVKVACCLIIQETDGGTFSRVLVFHFIQLF